MSKRHFVVVAAVSAGVTLAGLLTGLPPAAATPPGPDGDLVVSMLHGSPIHGIFTLNPADVNPSLSTVWEGNATDDPAGGIGASAAPSGLLAMSLPDGANRDKPTILTGTRTFKTDNTHLMPVPTTHVADYDPAWKPDGSQLAFTGVVADSTGTQRIAFTRGGDIWTMNTDGTEQKAITTDGAGGTAFNDAPAWKPDGTQLAFSGSFNGTQQLAAANPDGTGTTLLLPGVEAYNPAWSPDGTKVAFDNFANGFSQVAVLDVATKNVTQLTNDAAHENFYPAWSPDGTKLVFENFDDGSGAAQVELVPAAGGAPTVLTAGHLPAWSPDGKTIAFNNSTTSGGTHDVFTIPVTGGTPKQLTTATTDDYNAGWSVDGKTIVFTSLRDGHGEIWAMNADGTSQHKLTTSTGKDDDSASWGPAIKAKHSYIFTAKADGTNVQRVTLAITGGNPAWSPDGAKLAFSDNGRIFTIGPTGLGLFQVTTGATPTVRDADPSWSPDGAKLAFSGADSHGDSAIYTISPSSGAGLTKIAGSTGHKDTSPVWSPSGQKIAFIDNSDVWQVTPGGAPTVLKSASPQYVAQSLDWGSTGPPDTLIDSGPQGTLGSRVATFTFTSTRVPATFECSLIAQTGVDGGQPWAPCGSGDQGSKTYSGLGAGEFTFLVRATTATGTDATPATRSFSTAPPGVTVLLDGDGGGAVTSSPTGIACTPSKSTCSKVFNGAVTLTAKADGVSTFKGWTGDCTGTSTTCTVNAVTESKIVTATFALSGNAPSPCSAATPSTKSVGNWAVDGCFTGSGSSFSTGEAVKVNGLSVFPQDTTLHLNTSTGTLSATGRVLVLAGPVTVAGHKVGPLALYQGPLSLNLSAASLTLAPPGSFNLFGLPISGSFTLTAPSYGVVRAAINDTLPDFIGGGHALATLTADRTNGLHADDISVGPLNVTVASLFGLKNGKFTYKAGTGWAASGTIVVPGGSGSFSGTLVYSGQTLQSADVALTNVTIGGFLDTAKLELHYRTGAWSLSGVANGSTLSGDMRFDQDALSSLHLNATHVSVFGVVGIDSFAFSYDGGSGWSVTGAISGSAVSGSFSGAMTYADGVLTDAHLGVSNLSVGGVFSLTSLNLGYDSDGTRQHWHGTANLNGGNSQNVSADFVLAGHALKSGSFTAGDLPFFGVLDISNFHLDFNAAGASYCSGSPTSWGIGGTVSVPATSPFTIDAGMGFDATGAISCGHFHVAKAKLAQVMDINDLLVNFNGAGTWNGNVDVVFPGGVGIQANVTFVNGVLTQLGAGLTLPAPGLPMGPSGIFLHGGHFQLATQPQWVITGGLDITGGPTVPVINIAAFGVDGDLTLRFPSAGQPAGMRIAGAVKLAGLQLANAFVDYTTPFDVQVGGCLGDCANGINLGGIAQVKGSIDGHIQGTSAFQVDGKVKLSVLGVNGIDGEVVLSNVGVGACGGVWDDRVSVGLGYRWGQTPQAFTGCSLDAYKSLPSNGAIVHAAVMRGLIRTAAGVTVATGLPVEAFKFVGSTGAPYVTLTGPGGETIDARPETVGVTGDHIVAIDAANKTTYVIVDKPAAGAWTASPDADSVPIASSSTADGLPEPDVQADVTGDGASRTLSWTMTARPGQTVQFVETGPDTSQVLTTTSAATGSVTFTPAAGAAGPRDIVAEVVQNGVPRSSVKVATYQAPAVTVVTAATTGTGSGTVTSPAGLSCGPTCAAAVTPGQAVTLIAVPKQYSRFDHWTGACGGTNPTCTLTPDDSVAVTAVFTKIPPPTVTSFTPAAARPGSTVVVNGTNLTGATRVAFGKVVARVVKVVSPTQMKVVVPSGATTGRVSVVTPGGAATGPTFRVLPSITSFTPASAKRGTRVTISGVALSGATKVLFGGVAGRIVSVSYTRIVVVVPTHAKSGRITVTTPGGTATSPKSFTVRR